ncbi:MAG: hypothetical protein FD143_2830 [Ignavibacteria bacterium]|nr:MAG: hypothetical protein FD143_2830 [Ignavibacteria bacterium]
MASREYKRGKKPVIHSSQVYNYLTCPAMKRLSELIPTEPSKAMTDGLIIERMVFGDKDNLLPELLKGKKENTIAEYQRKADKIKPYFNGGEAFKKIEFSARLFDAVLVGEVDYFTDSILYDLKVSSSHKYWEMRNTKTEFLQAIFYPYILSLKDNLNNRDYTPREFHYVVFAQDTELVKTYVCKPDQIEKHFQWIEGVVDEIINEPFFSAYPDEQRCLQQTYGVCNYLDNCKEAQEFFNHLTKEVQIG